MGGHGTRYAIIGAELLVLNGLIRVVVCLVGVVAWPAQNVSVAEPIVTVSPLVMDVESPRLLASSHARSPWPRLHIAMPCVADLAPFATSCSHDYAAYRGRCQG